MLLPAPPLRLRKPRANPFRVPKVPSAPVPALTLVAATCDSQAPTLTLTFDRPIDISGFDGENILVDDYVNGTRYDAAPGATLSDPATVVLDLEGIEPIDPGTGVRLSANANSGIVAVDNGGVWAGAVNLLLPFP